ncbi:MAG: NosD domain-containing protein [Phycisphaerales bacterium]
MKTMTEVEPRIAINAANTPGDDDATPSLYKITQPGSYYLTGNITGVSGKIGIEIAVRGVTIDLNGFAVLGVAGSHIGIVTIGASNGTTVRNGVVSGWGNAGIYLTGTGEHACSVIDVRASSNGGGGIRIGQSSIVERCTVLSNSGAGISTGSGCTVTNCTATDNDQGIWLSSDCIVSGCTATQNRGDGIITPGGSVIKDCTSSANTGDGIYVGNNSIVTNNVCRANGAGAATGAGIMANGLNVRIEGNNCTNNDYNIRVDGTRCIVIRNTCSAAGTSDYSFVPGNIYGPIIDRRTPATPAVNGYLAASTLGSTDANANFSY